SEYARTMPADTGSAPGDAPLDADAGPPTSSAAWITAAQSGDGASVWTLLEARYQEDLLLFARHQIGRWLSRRIEPADRVQEAWLRALQDLLAFEYRGPGSFRRWLKTLIARAAKNEARRGASRDAREPIANRDIAAAADIATSPSDSPSHIVERVERMHRV